MGYLETLRELAARTHPPGMMAQGTGTDDMFHYVFISQVLPGGRTLLRASFQTPPLYTPSIEKYMVTGAKVATARVGQMEQVVAVVERKDAPHVSLLYRKTPKGESVVLYDGRAIQHIFPHQSENHEDMVGMIVHVADVTITYGTEGEFIPRLMVESTRPPIEGNIVYDIAWQAGGQQNSLHTNVLE